MKNKNMKIKKKAIQFFRVSSKKQEEGFSLSAQSHLAKKYVKEHNFHIIKTWSVSESASKEKDRKHFYEMLNFVRENHVKDIIFDKVDRACRGYKSAYLVEELISDYEVRFHFVRDHLVIDRNSPISDRDRFGIGVWMGKRYSENLRMEVMKGMEERRKQGHWNHKAPVGYINVRKGKRHGTVEIDPKTALFIKQVFEMYATGNYTQKELTNYLQEKLPQKKIKKSMVEITLLNPFYYGFMKYKGEVTKGRHKPLVSKKLWDNCQRIRGIRACKFKRNEMKTKTLKPLMGIFHCGECFSSITGEVQIKPKGQKYIYYHCGNQKCPEKGKNVRQDRLFAQVLEGFKPFQNINQDFTEKFLNSLKNQSLKIDSHFCSELEDLKERKLDLNQKLKRLENLYKKGLLEKEDYNEISKIKENKLEELETKQNEKSSENSSFLASTKKVIELLKKSYDFMNLSEDARAKARLAKIVLSNSLLKERTLQIHYEKSFDNLVKMLTSLAWCR